MSRACLRSRRVCSPTTYCSMCSPVRRARYATFVPWAAWSPSGALKSASVSEAYFADDIASRTSPSTASRCDLTSVSVMAPLAHAESPSRRAEYMRVRSAVRRGATAASRSAVKSSSIQTCPTPRLRSVAIMGASRATPGRSRSWPGKRGSLTTAPSTEPG